MSYHNLRGLFSGRGGDAAEAFDAWLAETMADATRRDDRLSAWERAPGARDAHPEAEHLLPLMVAAGAARGETATRIYADHVLGKPISAFRFG